MIDIFGKILSNVPLSHYIPSLTFVVLSVYVFEPILPSYVKERIGTTSNLFGQSGLIIILVTLLVAFILYKLKTSVFRLFEGSTLPTFLKNLGKNHEKNIAIKNLIRIKILSRKERRIETHLYNDRHLPNHDKSSFKKDAKNHRRFLQIKDSKYYYSSTNELYFPPIKDIQPTRFGNIRRATELYPALRYGIDTITVWPHLLEAMPDDYKKKIDQSNDQLSLMLNYSLLAIIFSIFCVIAIIYVILDTQISTSIYYYIVGGIISLLISKFFYQNSLGLAIENARTIRVAFDFYRFEILDRLELERPTDLRDEIKIWNIVSEFFSIGETMSAMNFNYSHHHKRNIEHMASDIVDDDIA
jgi:hypothetical protein